MATSKNYLKDKLEDDELDLSMMQLTDVPVKVTNFIVVLWMLLLLFLLLLLLLRMMSWTSP